MRRILLILTLAVTANAAADTYSVAVDPSLEEHSGPGRLILFFIAEDGGRWMRRQPASGPFFERPQPIASVTVPALPPGATFTIDDADAWFPCPLDRLEGSVRVQAVLDVDQTERGHLDGPGNLVSDVVETTLAADRDDRVELTLSHRIERPELPRPLPGVEWVRLRSERLSAFYGRDVDHLAGVVLPAGYDEPADADRRWPAIYVIPGYGGRFLDARRRARSLRSAAPGTAPDAVWIFLDPESPLGHHGFVDSPNHGPRDAALVEELIPRLERRFRLDPRTAARIVTGHSSGAWSSVWLQLRHPEVFGACWASAPDPLDFAAFQCSDLYADASLFTADDGAPRPSMRRGGGDGRDLVAMTVEQECRMEHAIDPTGRSGQQWDAWEAMFSPRDAATGLPRPMFDVENGAIDRSVVEHWSRFDITRLVTSDWSRYGPILMERVRIACGADDSFYLDRAARSFKRQVEARAAAEGGWTGPGYVLIVDGATHGSVARKVRDRWNGEMRAFLGGG